MSTQRRPTAPKPTSPTPTGASAYLQMVDQGTLWTAPSGAVIRVRDLTIMDRVLTDTLPNHLQEIVNRIIDSSEALSGDREDESDAELALRMLGGDNPSLREVYGNLYEMGVAFCVASWLEPEVVPTEADVTDPERQIPATRIAKADREAFLARTLGMDVSEAQRLAPFPGETS